MDKRLRIAMIISLVLQLALLAYVIIEGQYQLQSLQVKNTALIYSSYYYFLVLWMGLFYFWFSSKQILTQEEKDMITKGADPLNASSVVTVSELAMKVYIKCIQDRFLFLLLNLCLLTPIAFPKILHVVGLSDSGELSVIILVVCSICVFYNAVKIYLDYADLREIKKELLLYVIKTNIRNESK
ncbi:MAG: hypothetical protein ACLP29_11595 [Dissulfurispiraceae bacterium]